MSSKCIEVQLPLSLSADLDWTIDQKKQLLAEKQIDEKSKKGAQVRGVLFRVMVRS